MTPRCPEGEASPGRPDAQAQAPVSEWVAVSLRRLFRPPVVSGAPPASAVFDPAAPQRFHLAWAALERAGVMRLPLRADATPVPEPSGAAGSVRAASFQRPP
jgi:hypothetical protein